MRRFVLFGAVVMLSLVTLSTSAFAGSFLTFDLYTSAIFVGTGKSATCRAVNTGGGVLDVLAQMVDVNGNIVAAGTLSMLPQHNGAVTGHEFNDEFASVYCRFKISNKNVRASLTEENGSGFDAETLAVAEAR